uniref:HAD-IA family hydrolase n=1 Tax=Phocaeicola coprocola TaxID=310298 RepID=UPI0040389A4C
MSKPDPAIFQVALQEAELQPEETLFIDDAEVNCQAAASTGIQVAHYTPGTDLGDLFK